MYLHVFRFTINHMLIAFDLIESQGGVQPNVIPSEMSSGN